MRIGGYHPCSFCDFPGRLAAVVFTQGCNFRCPYCHNGTLLSPTGELIAEEEILRRLALRRNQIDAVVVSGGEPTLQSDLPQFLQMVRQIGLSTKLDTNGSNPAALAKLIDSGLLDYIAMDIKAPWNLYGQLAGGTVDLSQIAESIRLIASSGIAHEFRTVAVGALLNTDDMALVRAQIPGGSTYRVLPFRPEHDHLRKDDAVIGSSY